MQVILSRKGFDSVSGGGPSPILDDGRMVSIPIPDGGPYVRDCTYETLLALKEPPVTYAELGRQVGLKRSTGPAHLDPDLVLHSRSRLPLWRASLGQAGAAAGHLRNQNVGPGDLFLFFGLFRQLPDGRPFHSLYGYLEVDQVFEVDENTDLPRWLSDHPHATQEARRRYRGNRIYTARRALSFAPERSGWGVFRYRPELRLTPLDHTGLTQWDLPACLGPADGASVSYLPRGWSTLRDGRVRVEVRGNKQELVCRGSTDIDLWAMDLVLASSIWTS